MQAVPDSQPDPGFGAGLHHGIAFLHIHRHGFLADDMLASPGSPYGKFGMQAVGQHHVDNVNGLIVGNTVEILIIVHVAFFQAILPHPLRCLGGGAGHNAGQAAKLGLLQGRGQLVGTVASQPDQGHPQLFILGAGGAKGVGSRQVPGQEGPGQALRQFPVKGPSVDWLHDTCFSKDTKKPCANW